MFEILFVSWWRFCYVLSVSPYSSKKVKDCCQTTWATVLGSFCCCDSREKLSLLVLPCHTAIFMRIKQTHTYSHAVQEIIVQICLPHFQLQFQLCVKMQILIIMQQIKGFHKANQCCTTPNWWCLWWCFKQIFVSNSTGVKFLNLSKIFFLHLTPDTPVTQM